MDTVLARTFLEIVSTGSFVAAAERLHVTQTAVSARVRALEDLLQRRLFVRNRGGARLTPAGEKFRTYAATLVDVWERARQQVALPPGSVDLVSVGAEISLWNPLLTDLLVWLRRHDPALALRAEVDLASSLLDRVQDGSLDLAVLYDPEPRSDLVSELLMEDKLVMVTTKPSGDVDPQSYIYVGWGRAFAASHAAAFPELNNSSVKAPFGRLALDYMLQVGGAGYFRASVAHDLLQSGQLHRVRDAPEFSYSVHAAYSTRSSRTIIDRTREGLRASLGTKTTAMS